MSATPITAARQLQLSIVAALKTAPALAGADIRSNHLGPLSTKELRGVRVNLERTLRPDAPRLGAIHTWWQTYLQIDVLARATAQGQDPADALDPLLIAVFNTVASFAGPGIGAVSLLDKTAVDWTFDDTDPTVAKAVLHAQITHLASPASLTPIAAS